MDLLIKSFVFACVLLALAFGAVVVLCYIGWRWDRRRGKSELAAWEQRMRSARASQCRHGAWDVRNGSLYCHFCGTPRLGGSET